MVSAYNLSNLRDGFFGRREIRVDVLHVVVVLEVGHETEVLGLSFDVRRNLAVGDQRDLGRFDFDSRVRYRLGDGMETVRAADDFPDGTRVGQIIGAGVEHDLQQRISAELMEVQR